MTESIVNEKVLEFSSFLFHAAINSIASRKITKNRSGAKKTKKKKLWFDNECELKYRHLDVKGLARNLCNNPWDKNLRQKVVVYEKDFNRLF